MDPSASYDEYAPAAEFYDDVVPYRNRSDVAFFVEKARRASGPVLEIGCGTGRVLIPTAEAGVEIVGLDLSPAMLSVCREKLARTPADVQARAQLVCADMRQFDLARRFRLVTIPFRPFQHLITVADQLSGLSAIHRHLAEGGELILDLFNPSLPLLAEEVSPNESGQEPEFQMADGRRVLRRRRIVARDWHHQVQEIELIYYVTYSDGRQERRVHRFAMRYLFRFEAEHLLARSGFAVEAVYADYDKSPYGSKYPGELLFVARRV